MSDPWLWLAIGLGVIAAGWVTTGITRWVRRNTFDAHTDEDHR